jgi:hypothetical protein
MAGSITTYRDQRTLTERVHPVLVPKRAEQLRIQATLEDGNVKLVVRVRVDTKVFNFIQGDRLVLGSGGIGRRITLIVMQEISSRVLSNTVTRERPLPRDNIGKHQSLLCRRRLSCWDRSELKDVSMMYARRACGTYHDGQVRVTELLVCQLRIHVDSRQPTAITGMTVKPIPSTTGVPDRGKFTHL